MEVFDGRYYYSCKWFLSQTGLWPYLNTRRRLCGALIFCSANILVAIPQAILLGKLCGKNVNVTFENSVALMFVLACLSKYLVTYASAYRLKALCVQISQDWQRLKDKKEREILSKYSEEGRFLVLFYTAYIFLAWIVYTWMPFVPAFLDIIYPLNQSRPYLLPLYGDYIFFDQIDYHYWVCFENTVLNFINLLMFNGVDTIFVAAVKHACGLFAITRYRLETLVKIQNDFGDLLNSKKMISELRETVILHEQTIRCSGLLEDSFNICFFLLNCMSVVAMALAGVYFIIIYEDVMKVLRVVIFTFGLLIHLLYLNWVGQMIIDSSEKVFLSAYFSKWYVISTESRKMTGIIMARSITPCSLTAGKITVLCMESFGNLIKTTVSYFTVFLAVT